MKEWLKAVDRENVKTFYDDKYKKHGLDLFQGGNWEKYRSILENAGGKFYPQKKLADFGCGHGEFLSSLREDVTRYGFEISPEAVRLAGDRLRGIFFIYNLGIEDARRGEWRFDYVTCFGVLEHTMNPKECFDNLYSLLNSNGCLLITVPLEFEGCFSSLMDEPNKTTNERFMTSEEWIDLFNIKPFMTEIIGGDIAMVYKS